jgi:hypothetical protein
MKKVMCDICGKEIKLKKGNLFVVEVQKITDNIEDYPNDYGSDCAISKDYCKSCIKKFSFLVGYPSIPKGDK